MCFSRWFHDKFLKTKWHKVEVNWVQLSRNLRNFRELVAFGSPHFPLTFIGSRWIEPFEFHLALQRDSIYESYSSLIIEYCSGKMYNASYRFSQDNFAVFSSCIGGANWFAFPMRIVKTCLFTCTFAILITLKKLCPAQKKLIRLAFENIIGWKKQAS